MNSLFFRLVCIVSFVPFFIQTSQLTAPVIVAFYGSYSAIDSSLFRTLIKGFNDRSMKGTTLELNNECLENEGGDCFFVIDNKVNIVYLKGSSNITCDIVFPNGAQGCSVIREEKVQFTGNIVNGTLSDKILPSSVQSDCCAVQ